MQMQCEECCGIGFNLGYAGQYATESGYAIKINCLKCNGTGWYDGEDLVLVPKKYVDKHYWTVALGYDFKTNISSCKMEYKDGKWIPII